MSIEREGNTPEIFVRQCDICQRFFNEANVHKDKRTDRPSQQIVYICDDCEKKLDKGVMPAPRVALQPQYEKTGRGDRPDSFSRERKFR